MMNVVDLEFKDACAIDEAMREIVRSKLAFRPAGTMVYTRYRYDHDPTYVSFPVDIKWTVDYNRTGFHWSSDSQEIYLTYTHDNNDRAVVCCWDESAWTAEIDRRMLECV